MIKKLQSSFVSVDTLITLGKFVDNFAKISLKLKPTFSNFLT